MSKRSEKQVIKVLGIDLAKKSFHVYGVDSQGRKVMSQKVSRAKLAQLVANLPPCMVAMEACGSAHYWGRRFRENGHTVRLLPPQYVKPYVKTHKNDAVDAEAICEAAQRPNMRFVPLKETHQQDIQSVHRMRSLMVDRRTAQINQIRGLLLEYGIDLPKGRGGVDKHLPEVLEDADNGLSALFRAELKRLGEELAHLNEQVAHYDEVIEQIAQDEPKAQLLMTIPGVGPKTATALVAALGEVSAFKNGRQVAAWLGLVPRQHSTGGRERLLGISKHGDVYLRMLLIHGARAVLKHVERKDDPVSVWAASVKARRHANVAVVALANKMARMAYALLSTGKPYCAEQGAGVVMAA